MLVDRHDHLPALLIQPRGKEDPSGKQAFGVAVHHEPPDMKPGSVAGRHTPPLAYSWQEGSAAARMNLSV